LPLYPLLPTSTLLNKRYLRINEIGEIL